jgi:hypothetical protein
MRPAFIVTMLTAACASSAASPNGSVDASARGGCPDKEPTAGAACEGTPDDTPDSPLNDGCDFSHSCGIVGAHYDALYICVDGKWRRDHSNGCNPPAVFDTGTDSNDAADADAGVCCPVSMLGTGCQLLGGWSPDGKGCERMICDGLCDQGHVKDEHGCLKFVYRSCVSPMPDTGAPG